MLKKILLISIGICFVAGIIYWNQIHSANIRSIGKENVKTQDPYANVLGMEIVPLWLMPSMLGGSHNYILNWYSVYDGSLYCMGAKVSGVDYSTLQISSLGEFAKDKKHVYRCTDIVQNADPASFTVLNADYAKDSSHVFIYGKVLIGADPSSFQIIFSPMSHDETSSTLTAKDKYHAYYVSQIIAGADLDTFNGWRDKNWIYQNGERWGPAVLLSDLYAKDLPSICVEKGYIPTSTMPAIFTKDLSVVGYATFSTVCVIDTKTRQPQYFPYGTDNGVGLSDDGSKLLYQVYESEGAAMNGVTCSDCGTYFIDRATGKTGKLK